MSFTEEELQRLLFQSEQALLALYSGQNQNERDVAHKWLLTTQKSPQAWQLCWRLMQRDKAPEIQFFGASMLHFKISKNWNDLQEEHYSSLRSEIFRHILLFSSGPRIVLTRLCIALGAFALNTMPDHWNSAISEIIKILQNAAANSSQTLKCLISWVQFGVTIMDLENVLPVVFEATCNPELFDTTVDLLVEIATHPSGSSYPTHMWKFLSNVLLLGDPLRTALQSGDMDTSNGLCRVLVSLAESHMRLLLSADNEERELQAFSLVQLLLECTGAPGCFPTDEQCSEMTFNFWYTLQVLTRKMYVFCLLRGHCLQQFCHILSTLLSGEAKPSWQSVDATLYLVQAVSEYVEPNEESYIPAILSMLPRLPDNSYVSQTALLMVGSYSEWLKCHPDHLRSVLPVLLGGLSQEQLASASTQALRDICEECVQDMEPSILLEILSHCQTALCGSVMKERERIRCVECIGHVLSVQAAATAIDRVRSIFNPYCEGLARLVQHQVSPELKDNLQYHLQVFMVLFKCLDPDSIENNTHPAAIVLNDILPSLKSMGHWLRESQIQQSFCLCLERAMGTIRDHMGMSLVSSLAELIVGYYNASPSSELLDSASTLVGMYGMVDEHKQTMLFVFQKMTSSTLQLLQHNFREHPDILQSFLQFANRSLKSNPKLVFEPDNRHVNIFQCGLATLDVQESHTVRAACSFFSTFITASENQETAKNTLSEYGPYLVSQVGIAGGVPRQCIDHMAEILFALNRHDISLLSRWMQDVMQVEGFPSSLVSLTQKQDFVKAVLK
ncbi:Importin-13 [Acropora cervicornis]|uniref:Importin-13 n=1 Tax=Acropora cervicornis TaxID=6130 RepID=A0AAD9Q8G2_ACRCE|nr:Importin-13 [Acropora cervicornis]